MDFNDTLGQAAIITHFLDYSFLGFPAVAEINPLYTLVKFLSHRLSLLLGYRYLYIVSMKTHIE
jgi:hypothetical protein